MTALIRPAPASDGAPPDCISGLFEPRNGTGIELVIQTIHAAPLIAEVQQYGCAMLRSEAESGRGTQDLIANLSGVELIVQAMKNHPDDADVQASAAGALANVVHDNGQNQAAAISFGAVELVLRAMTQYTTSAEVQNWCCGALRNLICSSADGLGRSVAAGGFHAVLKAVTSHSDEPVVQGAGCAILGIFALHGVVKAGDLAASVVVDAVMQALREHQGSAKVQSCACAALSNIFGGEGLCTPEGRSPSEAPGLVIRALREYPYDVEVQECGLVALQALSTSPELRARFATLEWFETVNASMIEHETIDLLQRAGVLLMSRLCNSEEACAKVATNPVGFLTAMNRLLRIQDIQEACCVIVSKLASMDSAWRARLVEQSSVRCVIQALRAFPHNEYLHTVGFEALQWTIHDNIVGQAYFESENGIAEVLLSLDSYADNARIQKAGWIILDTMLAHCPARRQEAIAGGVIERIPLSASAHLAEPVLQRCVCNVLAGLAGDACSRSEGGRGVTEFRLELVSNGCHRAALNASSSQPNNDETQTSAFQAISLLVRGIDHACAELARQGAVEACIASLLAHPNCSGVQRHGCAVIRDLTEGEPSTRMRFILSGVAEIILRSLKTHTCDGDIQQNGLEALRQLAGDGVPIPWLGEDGPLKGIAETIEPFQEEELDEDTDPMALKRKAIVRAALASVCLHVPTYLSARSGVCACLTAMRAHPSSLGVQRAALYVLRRIAAVGAGHKQPSGASARGDIVAQGGVEAIAKALRTHGSSDVDVEENSCAIFGLLAASNISIREYVANIGANELVISALGRCPSLELQVVASAAFYHMVSGIPENEERIVSLGVIEVVLEMMRKLGGEDRAQRAGGDLLVLLATDLGSTVCRRLYEGGALEVALETLTDDQATERTRTVAFELLCCMCAEGPEPRASMMNAGGFDLLVCTMQRLPDCKQTQERGCLLIDDLSKDSIDFRNVIIGGSGDGLAVVIEAARRQASMAKVQLAVCALTERIAADSVGNRFKAGEVGATKAVIDAMRHCIKNVAVEVTGCKAVMQLCRKYTDNVERFVKEGAVKAVCLAMFKGEQKKELQEFGCGALRYLMADNEDVPEEATDMGAMQIVFTAIENFPDSALVLEHGLSVISHLAWHSKNNQADAMLMEGIPRTFEAMKTHAENPMVLAFACAVLNSIGHDNKNNREELAKAGAIELVLEAMEAHPSAANVQAYACAALATIACGSFSNRRKLVKAGVEDLVLDAMETHPYAKKLQEFAQTLLDTLEG